MEYQSDAQEVCETLQSAVSAHTVKETKGRIVVSSSLRLSQQEL